MALTRKFLKALGIEEDKVEEIIAAHGETVTALKDQIEEAGKGAETLTAVTKERDRLQADIAKMQEASGDAEKVRAEFDAYRQKVEAERATAGKAALLTDALRAAGVQRESALKLLLRAADMDALTIADGKLTNADVAVAALRGEYGDLFGEEREQGVPRTQPPVGGGADLDALPDEDYYKAIRGRAKPD